MMVQGTDVVVRNAQTITDAHTILKSKKATDAEKLKATTLLRQVYNCDDGVYYGKFLAYAPQAKVDALTSNILSKSIYEGDKLPTVLDYMRMLPAYAQTILQNRAVARIQTLYNYKLTDEQLATMQKEGTLLIYEYLCTGVAVCVAQGTNKAGEPTVTRTYITRNPQILYMLASNNYIKDVTVQDAEEWVQSKLDVLFGSSVEKNLKDGKVTVMCLKPESDGTAMPKYTVTKRQAPYVLTGEENVTIYPIETYKVFSDLTVNLLKTGVWNVSYKKLDGTIKETILTLSCEAAQYCYEEIDDTVATYTGLFTQSGLVGWRPAYFGLNAFSLKKDKFTTFGLAVDTFDGIRAYNPQNRQQIEIPELRRTSENYRDVVAARMIFTSVVSRMRKEYFELFENDVPALANVKLCKDKRAVLLRWSIDVSDEDLYDLLSSSRFDNMLGGPLKERCKVRRRTMPTYFKNYKPVAEFKDYDKLSEILMNGVLQVAYITSSGNLQTLNLTNNKYVLRKTYGENYIAVWETSRIRLLTALAEMTDMQAGGVVFKNPEQLELLRKYDLFNVVFPDGNITLDDSTDAVMFEQLLHDTITRLNERKPKVPVDKNGKPAVLTARVADGIGLDPKSNTLSFYRTLYLNRIIYAMFTEVKIKTK